MKIDTKKIQEHRSLLENHSLLTTNMIQSIEDLRIFMEDHVYAVWDFMSLIKSLQNKVVPSTEIWMPHAGNRSDIARIINEIVLCEESDISPDGKGCISHFDLYLQAMLEIGCDVKPVLHSIQSFDIQEFSKVTLAHVEAGAHCAAASFCYGRETVIPSMFTRILRQLNVSDTDAPKFHYYLERHIEVDGEDHGPMAEKMVNYFCKDDPILIHEAEQAAIEAIQARIRLFDKIEEKLL